MTNHKELPTEVTKAIKKWMGSSDNILHFWEDEGTYYVVQQFDSLYFLRLFKMEWYSRSYIVDGVRVGPLTKEYHLKQLFALREQAFEELQVYDLEIEKLLDERAMEFRKMRSDARECDHAFTEGERHCVKCGVLKQGVA